MKEITKFKDYPADQIAAKLAEVVEFEKKYKPNSTTKSWRKWCTDHDYRQKEWEFRQSVSKILNE